jgi:serine/threonine-protein kinase HipA
MDAAYVKIWGELVGAVLWDETTGYATFEYDPAFLRKGWELAPLQMPISAARTPFSFPVLRKKPDPALDTFKGLPGLLADALPDRYGSELINQWLAQQGRSANSMNPVEMLCFIGNRGMGALEFEPTTIPESKRTFSVEMDSLVDIAQRMLSKKEAFTTILSEDDKEAVADILRIGTFCWWGKAQSGHRLQ